MDSVKEGFSDSIKELTSNKYFFPVVIAASASAAFYSILDPIVNAYNRKDSLVVTVYVLFFIFVIFIGFLLRPKRKDIKPPERGIFQGVGKLNIDDAWPRTDDRIRLCDTIRKSKGKPIIFVGSSGVGKSILLETQVLPFFTKECWETILFSNYDIFQAQLMESLTKIYPDISHEQFLKNGTVEGIDPNIKLILIFDQFEQFLLANSDNSCESIKMREWFKAFIENSTKFSKIRHLIVVRKEWYYDLRFLERFVQPPIESFHLSGLKIDENESGGLLISSRLKTVTKNPHVTDVILSTLKQNDEILPVEAQMVGLMLENKIREVGEIDSEYYLRELGGKDGIIHSYFRAYLNSSPNPDISLKTLFALSVETVLRSQHSLSQIADVIHESKADVSKCIAFFVDQGIVIETKTGLYELAHDYLAEKFHELSGAELDPVERDNITFFCDETRRHSEPLDITRPKMGAKRKLIFSDYFMIFLSILLIARLMGPIYGIDWGWVNILSNYQTQKAVIDIYFLPVFISHLAWSIYVTLFYRRFFSHLKESTSGRLLSKFTVINCTLCVTVAVFLSYFWLLSIGIGGFVVGIKLYRLSRSSGLGKVSSVFFRNVGIKTMINVSIVLALGVALIVYVNSAATLSNNNNFAEQLNIASILVAMVMTYYMIAVTPLHITKNATSKMMGLIDRGRVRSQRLKSELSKFESNRRV